MNLPISSARSAFVFALVLGFLQIVNASGDVNSDLEALRKKIAAKEAEQQGPSQGGRQLSFQLKQLQGLIARADYDRVEQMLGNLGEYGLTPELQEEWTQVFELLGKEIKRLQAASMEKWRGEVDQLVADVKKRCLEANSSADLDELLVHCAALQMRRAPQNTILSERTNRKLAGAASTLTAWMNYLDFRDAGNSKRANETLRGLRTSDSVFPILKVQEIETRFIVDEADPLNPRTELEKMLQGLKSPEDLTAVVERMKSAASNPMNPDPGLFRNELNRMQFMQQAWEAVNSGDDESAQKAMERFGSTGGSVDTQSLLEPLKKRILSRVVEKKAQCWTKLAQDPNEETALYLTRVLDELKAKASYSAMLDVMKYSDQLNRMSPATYAKDRAALEQFLAAQRFEAAGDFLAAVTNYRFVVGTAGTKYAPLAECEEALKRIQEKNPDALKSYEGVLMEELRALRQQVQLLLSRNPGGRLNPPY